MSVSVVRPLAPADIDAACEVLGSAFADNPSTLNNVGGDHTKAQRMMERTVRAVKLGVPFSHALVAEQHGELVGVLNAAPWPHCQLRPKDRIKRTPKMLYAAGTALPRLSRMASARAKHDPREPHWHVGPIGVRPDHQGHCVGSDLLTEFLRTADEQMIPAFLETDVDKNVAFYERFGFAVIATADIMGINTRFMARPSQTNH
jgi:GNAT superfamily N-acetyltransferase